MKYNLGLLNNACLVILLIPYFYSCQSLKKGEIAFSGEELFLQKTDLLVKDTSLFKNCEVIPLELKDLSTIKDINKVLLFEDKIGVVDLASRALLIFDRQGNFLHEIKRVGNGPGEYSQLWDVCLDPVDSCFAFLTSHRFVMFYSYTGEFKYSINIEKTFQKMVLKGDYIYLQYPDQVNYDKQEYSIMSLNRRNGKICDILEQGIRPVESLWADGYTLTPGKDAIYYIQRYTNRIYKVTGESYTPLYELNLGKFELPDHLKVEDLNKESFIRELANTWSVFSLTNFCELSNGFMLSSNLPGFFYYNSQTEALEHFDQISNKEYGVDFYSFTPVEPAGKNIAFVLNEDRLASMKEHRKEHQGTHETPALKALLDRLPNESNPVIFLYSIKEE